MFISLPDCPSCLAHFHSIAWVPWTIRAALRNPACNNLSQEGIVNERQTDQLIVVLHQTETITTDNEFHSNCTCGKYRWTCDLSYGRNDIKLRKRLALCMPHQHYVALKVNKGGSLSRQTRWVQTLPWSALYGAVAHHIHQPVRLAFLGKQVIEQRKR